MERTGAVGLALSAGLLTPPGLDAALLGPESRGGEGITTDCHCGVSGDVCLSGPTLHPAQCAWRAGGGGGEPGTGSAVLYRLPGGTPGAGADYGPAWQWVDDRSARA